MFNIPLKATARVKLIKKDADGNVIEVVENTVELTEEEVEALWLSQQQDCNS